MMLKPRIRILTQLCTLRTNRPPRHSYFNRAITCRIGMLVFAMILTAQRHDAMAQRPAPADLVLLDGRIVTMDPQRPRGEALSVRGDRIVAVGTSRSIAAQIGPQTRVIRLGGRLVLPGFIEGHGHFLGLGQSKMILDLSTAGSWKEIVEQVARAARKTPAGTWILGRGWHQSKWRSKPVPTVEGNPTHVALSKRTPDHPVLLTHASGHMCIANARAMQLAGLNRQTKSPAGGEILHDADGNPTGVLRENAMRIVRRVQAREQQRRTAAQRQDDLLQAIRLASDECLRYGVTSFQDAGTSFATIDVYRSLARQGRLPVRLWVMTNESNPTLARHLDEYRMLGAGQNHLTVRSIKRLVDGALGSHGAWLLEPYADLPNSRGLNTLSLSDLQETAELAIAHDCQLCVHAIGDRANREVLNVFEKTFQAHPDRSDLRWRIEHAQHLDPADIPRFAQLGVIASMQAVHATSDGPFVVERLGLERARAGAYVWNSLLKSGAVVSNGTDVPVERVDPLAGIYSAVTRKMNDGKAFFPEQCLTRMQALKCYTQSAAYAAFEEDLKGSLTVGKLADIAVLSKDILTVPADEIRSARVLYTIVGGKVMYEAPTK